MCIRDRLKCGNTLLLLNTNITNTYILLYNWNIETYPSEKGRRKEQRNTVILHNNMYRQHMILAQNLKFIIVNCNVMYLSLIHISKTIGL